MANNIQHIFRTPENFTPYNVKYFLADAQQMFGMNGKHIPDVVFDASNLRKAGLLGQLLIYKFIEFSVKKGCFLHPKFSIDEDIFKEFKRTGFQKLVLAFINNKEADYEKLKYEEDNDIFIAPINLAGIQTQDTHRLFAPQICQYYTDTDVAFLVLTCITEIASNFSAHAEDDTNSILVAKGNHNYFEIACADNGIGIVSSLGPCLSQGFRRDSSYEVLKMSIKQGVTSKSKKTTNHMGYGLWLISEFVTMLGGELYIYSENAYLQNKDGRVKSGQGNYWKGTIIYIKMPLSNKEDVRKIHEELLRKYRKRNIKRL